MNLISVKKIKKIYNKEESPTEALSDISFEIKKGEFVAIMGPSGSGKSTLLHILGFLDRPTEGQYLFEEKSMDEYTDDDLAKIRNKKMGFIFQSFSLLPRTTVLDNVLLPLEYTPNLSLKEKESMAKKVIEMVGLGHRMDHEPSQLSGGEKQRVAIARALVVDPAVIFADEPTGNLDSKSGGQIMEYISDLNKQGHTIILITHETYTAQYAERIIRIKDGLVESDERVLKRNNGNKEFVK